LVELVETRFMPGDLDRSPDVRQPERYSSQEIPAFAGMTDPVVN
jgi:hypothetical protein